MDELIRDLARATIGGTFNQYRDAGPDDLPGAAERRCANLRHYLAQRRRAGVLAVGEAGGYQGMRWSGIAFTSERDLAVWGDPFAATCAARRWSEPSGTIVHRVLGELGAELDVVLWNTVPTHPHRAGEPLSNRRPTTAEIAAGAVFVERAVEIIRPAVVVAVGRIAESVLGERASYVRHPANGGGAAFAEGLRAILASR
ncbi:MAG TPA: uracil-DNA glycosylase [Gaiellales bacterium]|nr:uracil-DNA glycosylase [Gaiellales bacterium]